MPAGSSRRMAHMTALWGSCFQQRRASFTKPSPSKGTDVPWMFCHCLVAGGPESLRLLLHVQGGGTTGWRRRRPRPAPSTTSAGPGWRSPPAGGSCRFQRRCGPVPPWISRQVTAVFVAVAQAVHLAGAQPADGGLGGSGWRCRGRTVAMVWPGWAAASRNTVSLIRACTWAKVSPPRTPELRGAVVEADQVQGVLPLQRAPGLVLPHPPRRSPAGPGWCGAQPGRGPGRWPGRWSWCGTGRWSTHASMGTSAKRGPAGPRSAGSRSR